MFYSNNVKTDVEYSLDKELRNQIICVRDICERKFINSDILLFGSIAKGKYKNYSDIDILILINDDISISELRKLRHELEDSIDELKLNRDVDIKLYNKLRYIELTKDVSFEQAIVNDLISLRGWKCG